MHFSRAYVKCIARADEAAAPVGAEPGGQIYVVGGTCPAEVYDAADDRWERLPEMVDVQFFCTGILGLDTHLLYAYGYDILDPDFLIEPDVNSARVYDLVSRTWSSVAFDFSRCCTSVSGRLVIDIVDGILTTYDMINHTSMTLDGTLQVCLQSLN